jgi:exodeoxyribonuclease V beta subunit
METLDPKNIPLHGIRLIEASAGTGKTYTIALIYLRLLLERGLTVPEILVVTYTNAATEELRDRVRAFVRLALQVAEGGETDDADVRAIVERAGEPETVRQRLADALTRMDEAAVFTIHGFCQRLLQDSAFESGALYDPEFISSESDLRHAIVEDFWRRRLYPAPAEETAWALSQWKTPAHLLQVLGQAGRPEIAILPEPDAALRETVDRARSLHRDLRALWQAEGATIAGLVTDNPVLHRGSYRAEAVGQALEAMEEHLASDGLPPSLHPRIELLTETKLTACTKKGRTTPSHRFFGLCERYRAAFQQAGDARRALFLTEAAAYLRDQLPSRKRERRVLFFDDLLADVEAALARPGGETLSERARSQCPVALIDEFQDTDPLQYAIFERIYRDRPQCALFLIGDPKQAIYSFRGADIFAYIRAKRATAGADRQFTLPTNWRSGRPLVQAVNALFGSVRAPFLYQGDIDFQPVEAAGRADEKPLIVGGKRPVPLRIWRLPRSAEDPAGKAPPPISKERAKQAVAQACAAVIARLLEQGASGDACLEDRPLKARDLAVLVRDRYEAEAVQQALTAVRVPSVYYGRDSVYQTEEAQELARVLLAVAEPEDERALRAALCTRLLGKTASELEALTRDETAWEAAVERLRGYGTEWRGGAFTGMVQRLLQAEGVVPRLLALPDGERRLTNLLQLAELLQHAAADRPGPDALLRWLADQRAVPDVDSEEQQLRLESDENLVKVFTLHRSKGLQWPVVFLPFPWSAKPVGSKGAFIFHDDAERLCLDLGSPAQEEHRALAERERLAEELRLLYVAVTRAKYLCCLSWGAVNGAPDSALAYLLHQAFPPQEPDSVMEGLDDTAIRRDLNTLAARAPGCIAVEELPAAPTPAWRPRRGRAAALAARPFTGYIDRTWRVTSYSGLAAGRDPEQPDYDAFPSPAVLAEPGAARSIFDFPRGARSGLFMHALMESLDFPQARGNALATVVALHLGRFGFPRAWQPVVEAMVADVLDTLLDASGLSLRVIERKDRLDELEFYYPLAPFGPASLRGALREVADYAASTARLTFSPVRGLMKGFIDLVFRWRGRFYLADYKSNHLGDRVQDYGPAGMAEAMTEHRYHLQYLIYTVALHRYLSRRVPAYDYERDFGGVYYLFLRGMRPAGGAGYGVTCDRPPRAVIETLDRLFAGSRAA